MSKLRSILGMCLGLAVVAAGCGTAKVAQPNGQLAVPITLTAPPQSAVLVALADYGVESPFTKLVNIVRLSDGQFLALSAKDPNMGCTVTWNKQWQAFANPCHGARYAIRGEAISGPAIRGLDRFPLRVDAAKGKLYIDVAVEPEHGGAVHP